MVQGPADGPQLPRQFTTGSAMRSPAQIPPRPAARAGEPTLDLGDTRLPWLEVQESEELTQGGSGRLWLIGLVLFALLVAAGAGAWVFLDRRAKAAMVETGGLIRAPEGPYKVRPSTPGGQIAAGTGDARFLVAEGKSRAVHVGGDGPVVAPAVGPSGVPSAAAGSGVQIGAYPTAAEAEAAWPTLSARVPVLSGLQHRVVEQQADLGSVFALQAVTGDVRASAMLCRDIKVAGLNCQVR